MRVFKTGFTLAETLVALAIIGVVASMTIPQVVQNTQKNQAGIVLARAVEQIETGCQNMIQKANDNISIAEGGYFEGIYGLTTKEVFGSGNAKLYGESMFKNGKAFFGITPIQDSATYLNSIKDFSGDTLSLSHGADEVYSLNKQKALLIPVDAEMPDAEYDAICSVVMIDVNGTAKPNRGGKDIFVFGVTNSGKLIPKGSKKYNNDHSNSSGTVYTNTCNETTVTTGWDCAAKVVKDGFKITYY